MVPLLVDLELVDFGGQFQWANTGVLRQKKFSLKNGYLLSRLSQWAKGFRMVPLLVDLELVDFGGKFQWANTGVLRQNIFSLKFNYFLASLVQLDERNRMVPFSTKSERKKILP